MGHGSTSNLKAVPAGSILGAPRGKRVPLPHFPRCPLGGGTGRRRRRQPEEQEEVEAAFRACLLSRFHF